MPAGIAANAAAAWARTRSAAVLAFNRARDGMRAAANSPRTRRATATVREYAQRAADATADGTRRLSAFTREQFERDPRRAWMLTAAIGAVILILIIAVIMFSGGNNESGASSVQPSEGVGGAPAATQAAAGGAAPPAPSQAATAAATASQPVAGSPYGEAMVTSAIQSRGLAAAPVNDAFACQNPGTTPKPYSVTGAGGEQRFVLLVYSDASAMNTDWVIGGGRPQYKKGSCAEEAGVIYFNQNVLLVFPQTTSAALQSQIADAFLTLP